MAKILDLQKLMLDALKQITRPDQMRKYGEQAAQMIQLRTRLGKGVSRDGADKESLKPLKESTVRERRRLAKQEKLSKFTSPRRSNLTRTGQLLDSEGVTQVAEGVVRVGPKGTRKDGKTNAEVGFYVSIQGREFNNLSRVELKRVNDAIKRDLKTFLERRLTKNTK